MYFSQLHSHPGLGVGGWNSGIIFLTEEGVRHGEGRWSVPARRLPPQSCFEVP